MEKNWKHKETETETQKDTKGLFEISIPCTNFCICEQYSSWPPLPSHLEVLWSPARSKSSGKIRGTEADFNKKRSPNFDSLKHPSFQPYEPFPYTNSIRQIHPTIRSVRFPNFYPQNMARLGALLATPFVSAFAPWENIDANYGIIWKSCWWKFLTRLDQYWRYAKTLYFTLSNQCLGLSLKASSKIFHQIPGLDQHLFCPFNRECGKWKKSSAYFLLLSYPAKSPIYIIFEKMFVMLVVFKRA